MSRRVCIGVPARNEQEHLPMLLDALAAQTSTERVRVIVTLNNCTDASEQITRAAVHQYSERLDIHPDVIRLHPPNNHVGAARARALRLASMWLDKLGIPAADQVLLSTDADATPPQNWVSANLAAIDAGADIVGGRLIAVPDPTMTAEEVHRLALADRYWACVRALEDRIDPVAEDPAPRHGDHTGASLAIRRMVYDAAGGIPLLPTGEDIALVQASTALGYRLRHSPDVRMNVSARLKGRAAGGMAENMRTNRRAATNNVPMMLPGAAQWKHRATWRAAVRAAGGAAAVARTESCLPPLQNDTPVEVAIDQLKYAI